MRNHVRNAIHQFNRAGATFHTPSNRGDHSLCLCAGRKLVGMLYSPKPPVRVVGGVYGRSTADPDHQRRLSPHPSCTVMSPMMYAFTKLEPGLR